MPYAEGRIYNDADSHIMETRDWLASYIDPRLRDRLPPPDFSRTGRMADAIGKVRDERHWQSVNLEANLMNLKGWDAYGAIDRPNARVLWICSASTANWSSRQSRRGSSGARSPSNSTTPICFMAERAR